MTMDEMNIPDPKQAFVEQINRKQRAAFHKLFQEFFQSLVIYALKFVHSNEEAEDIVQEVFVNVWERKEHFISYQNLRAFLYRSVKNACLDILKHKTVEEKYIAHESLFPERWQSDGYEWLQEEIYREFFKVVDELPPRCRQVFLMHLDGKKNEEIARELGLSLLTVKTQKKKAMRYVREQMTRFLLTLMVLFDSL